MRFKTKSMIIEESNRGNLSSDISLVIHTHDLSSFNRIFENLINISNLFTANTPSDILLSHAVKIKNFVRDKSSLWGWSQVVPLVLWNRYLRLYFSLPYRVSLHLENDNFFTDLSFSKCAAFGLESSLSNHTCCEPYNPSKSPHHQIAVSQCSEGVEKRFFNEECKILNAWTMSVMMVSSNASTRHIWISKLSRFRDLAAVFFSSLPAMYLDVFAVDYINECALDSFSLSNHNHPSSLNYSKDKILNTSESAIFSKPVNYSTRYENIHTEDGLFQKPKKSIHQAETLNGIPIEILIENTRLKSGSIVFSILPRLHNEAVRQILHLLYEYHRSLFLETFDCVLNWWNQKPDCADEAKIIAQHHLTCCLLIAMGILENGALSKKNSLDITLGIQHRLNILDSRISLHGKIVAESFASLLGKKLDFNLTECNMSKLLRYSFKQTLNQISQCDEFNLDNSVLPQDDGLPNDHVVGEKCIKAQLLSQPTTGTPLIDEERRNAKVRRPRFARDCLAYLKCTEDPEKLNLSLEALPTVLNSTSDLTLIEIGKDLFQTILFQGDDYGIIEFDKMRRIGMIDILRRAPDTVAPVICHLFTAYSSISIHQRLEIICVTTELLLSNTDLVDSSILNIYSLEKDYSINFDRLKSLDKIMGFQKLESKFIDSLGKCVRQDSQSKGISKISHKLVNVIVRKVVLPIISLSTEENCFKQASGMVLEKVLWMAAIALNCSQSNSFLRTQFLRFINPMVDHEHPRNKDDIFTSLPVKIALVHGLEQMTLQWKDAPVMEFAEDLSRITCYLDSLIIGGGSENFINTAVRTLLLIETELMSTERVISEFTDARSFDLSPLSAVL